MAPSVCHRASTLSSFTSCGRASQAALPHCLVLWRDESSRADNQLNILSSDTSTLQSSLPGVSILRECIRPAISLIDSVNTSIFRWGFKRAVNRISDLHHFLSIVYLP
ncbi:hypothetical protein BDV28DRAFT_35285 [Aspergillus coremiiformis]|uniref:Uncharacterized protein n=1 Tax=Aspergillus coremiiformis TaxID=138285 RepID=A0A5N6Z129_9EURO|nr:hypothetical protein BDV28DRAFT_35285 [Aspergillus coremiiformis]